MASCQAQDVGPTLELSGPRGCLTMTRRGALASSRVMLFSRFTSLSGRGVATCLGPSLHGQRKTGSQMAERVENRAITQKVAGLVPGRAKKMTRPWARHFTLLASECPCTYCKSLWIRVSAK